MTPRKKRRLLILVAGLSMLATATGLALLAFQDNLVFFYSPSDIVKVAPEPDRRLRVGGLVVANSVRRQADGATVAFEVTDMAETLAVRYRGVLPDLFREGQGIIAEGRLGRDGVFTADTVLAKHDETYMPAEVADALKRAGQWKPAPTGTKSK
jgi:cytochrome c-type biogenesis protein CcmE